MEAIEPGIYPDMPAAEYHAAPAASKSDLDKIARSPAHYRAYKENPPEQTKAMALGTAFHTLVLEPEKFSGDYCLALRRQDVPEAIEDRDQLVAMVQELNASRLPKLPASGSKPDLIARIEAEIDAGRFSVCVPDGVDGLRASELKALIAAENERRPGHLPTGGSRHELADLLRQNGVDVVLWSDVREQWEAANGHRTVLTPDEWDMVHRMRDAVMAHPAAAALLSAGKAEQSVFWRDDATAEFDPQTGEVREGLLCKCRPDWLRPDNIIVDLKRAIDASPEGFQRRAYYQYRYHVQAAHYSNGVEAATGRPVPAFVFIACEPEPPYAVGVYQVSAELMAEGRQAAETDLATLAACQRIGKWPGYPQQIVEITVPGRASKTL